MVIVTQVPNSLVVANLAATVWGKNMSRNLGFVDTARFLLSIIFTGPLGRLGDRYGSRVAMTLVAVLQSLPAFMLLLLGETAEGLTAWSAARVLTGITGATTSGPPALYALLHDVVPPADYDAFLGMTFAGAALLWMIGNLVGAAVLRASHGSSDAVLLYVASLTGIMLAILVALRMPKQASKRAGCPGSPSKQQQQQQQQQHQQQQDLDLACTDSEISNADVSHSHSDVINRSGRATAGAGMCAFLPSFRLALENKALLKLCAIAALVSVSETVLFELMNQFTYENLGLMGAGASGEERSFVTLVNVFAFQVSMLLGSYAVGLLAQRLTSLQLLKGLIPACAVLQSLPAVERVLPEVWVAVTCAVALGLSIVVLPPLQALVPQFSPETRVGEALGTFGSCKCLASLVGNLMLSAGVPAIQNTGLEKPLWIMFPVCGLVSLCSFPIVLQLPTAKAAGADVEMASTDVA